MAEWFMKQGDLTPSLQGQMIGPDGETPVDLTGYTLTFRMRPKDRGVVSFGGECEIVGDPEDGNWVYHWQEEDTDTAGLFDGEVRAVDSENRPMTLPNGEPSRPLYFEILISPRVDAGEAP